MNRVLFIALLSFIFSSCAYFNTFHNTKKLYNQATKERKKRTDDVLGATERKLYDDTIAKASKILELYPRSKYVDDALFILGECLYHKGESIKAQRKFQELTTYFPGSEYFDRAKVWLAKTDVRLKDRAAAKIILNELLQRPDLDKALEQEASFLLGEIHFGQGYYEQAAHEFHDAAKLGKEKTTTSEAWLNLGQCQLFFGNNQAAVTSFKNAVKQSPDNLQGFEARLSYARALKLTGDFKNAARLCNELQENQIYQKKHGYVQLELADIIYQEGKALNEKLKGTDLQYLGKIEEAVEKYDIVILQNKRSEVAAIAHYRIAKIRENDLHDFPGAKEHYEKVKLEYSRSEYAEEAEQRAKSIGDLIRLTNLVREAQGQQLMAESQSSQGLSELELLLLEHGVHPELRFMQEQKELARVARSSVDSDASGPSSEEMLQIERLNQLVRNKLQLAEIYLFQFGQIDSALAQYRQVVELFPDHPAAAKAIYSTAYVYENEFHNKFKTDSLLYLLIERFPESEQAREAHRKLGLPVTKSDEPAAELFRRAETTLFTHRDATRALQQYRRVIRMYPDSDYAPKALYASGWIHEQILFDNDKAAEIYLEIQKNYPDSEYFNSINQKLLALENLNPADEARPDVTPTREQQPTEVLREKTPANGPDEALSTPQLEPSPEELLEIKKRKLLDRRAAKRRAREPSKKDK
ncbi:MAG: tetratricopeptide repeat protein [bacterium]